MLLGRKDASNPSQVGAKCREQQNPVAFAIVSASPNLYDE
jgi:hypothetical protein